MTNEFIDLLKNINPMITDDTVTNLVKSGVIDSLDIMHIVAILEEKYCIEIDGDDISIESLASLQSIWDVVQKSIGG